METVIANWPPASQIAALVGAGVAGFVMWWWAARGKKSGASPSSELDDLRWQVTEQELRADHALALEAARTAIENMIAEAVKTMKAEVGEVQNFCRSLEKRVRAVELDCAVLKEASQHGPRRR